MSTEDRHSAPEIDEGSWVYLSTGPADGVLLEELTEACARSGWRAVSHPPLERAGDTAEPGRFFASVSHAVKHADVVVTVIGSRSEMSDAELTLAYTHGRPVVGVRVGDAPLVSEPGMCLEGYERARIVVCDSPNQCGVSLQETLADPAFAEMIRQAG